MIQSQEDHLQRIKQEFNQLIEPKFRKGAEEHKTLLHELSPQWLLDASIDEAIDQVTYLLTLKERLSTENLSLNTLIWERCSNDSCTPKNLCYDCKDYMGKIKAASQGDKE